MSEWEDRCTCTLSEKVVGDGCQYCNPELTIEMQAEEVADLERQLEEQQHRQPLDLESLRANLADIKVAVEQIETILAGGIEI